MFICNLCVHVQLGKNCNFIKTCNLTWMSWTFGTPFPFQANIAANEMSFHWPSHFGSCKSRWLRRCHQMPPMYGGSSRMTPATSPPTGNKVDGPTNSWKWWHWEKQISEKWSKTHRQYRYKSCTVHGISIVKSYVCLLQNREGGRSSKMAKNNAASSHARTSALGSALLDLKNGWTTPNMII